MPGTLLANCDIDNDVVDDDPENVIGESMKKSILIGILSICLSLSIIVWSTVPPEQKTRHQKQDFFAFKSDSKSGIVVLIGTRTDVLGSFESCEKLPAVVINFRAVSAVFITKTQTGASGGRDCMIVDAGKSEDEKISSDAFS